MDDGDLLLKMLRLRDRPVRDPRADDDQKIAAAHRAVGIGFSIVPEHAEIQRVGLRNDADSHHRMDAGDAVLLAECNQLPLRAGQNHAAARADQRFFRPVDRTDDLVHLLRVRNRAGPVAADADHLRIRKRLSELRHLDVAGQIDQHRSLPTGGRDIEGFPHDAGNVVCIFHKIAVFDEGLRRSAHVGFLKNIVAEKRRRDLARDRDQGNAVRIGRRERGDKVRGPRSR